LGTGIYSRRHFVLASLGAACVLRNGNRAFADSLSSGVCMLTPEQEEGPFYIAARHVRRDVAEGQQGIPLALRLHIVDARTCEPIVNYATEIWQCNALGEYSGYLGSLGPPGGGPPNGGPRSGGQTAGRPPDDALHHAGLPKGVPPNGVPTQMQASNGRRFLRGTQFTDYRGFVQFATIFPGFYSGRVNHIHVKVWAPSTPSGHPSDAAHVVHTGQVFFPEELARAISSQAPYVEHRIERTTLQEDPIFRGQSGRLSIARMLRKDSNPVAYVAAITVGVDRAAIPAPAQRAHS